MYCLKCKALNDDSSKFCIHCGAPLIKENILNTAEKMYFYCQENGFGQGMTKNWSIKHFKVIEDSLQNDENVLMCFIGLHNYRNNSKHDGNYAYAITNKRIIMAQKKMFGQNLQSVLLKNLNDITASTGFLSGIITIDTMKEEFNVFTNKSVANNICEKAHEVLLLLEDRKESKPVEPASRFSDADEIMKYKNLLDSGIITKEEFDKKKKQILGF